MPCSENDDSRYLLSDLPPQSRGRHEINCDDEGQSPWTSSPKQVSRSTRLTLASNYVNGLLMFVPLGITAGAMEWNQTTVFILGSLAIVPLASLLSFATEGLSARMGETIGGLMNATLSNAVESIVS